MNNPLDDKPNFLDRNTLLAIVIVTAMWWGWTLYRQKNYAPPAVATPEAVQNNPVAKVQSTTPAPQPESPPVPPSQQPEELLAFEDANLSFSVSSHGMGFKDINIKAYQTRAGDPVILGQASPALFASRLAGDGGDLYFRIEQREPGLFIGTARRGNMVIEKTVKVLSALYAFETSVKINGMTPQFAGLETVLSDEQHPSKGGGIFAPSYDHQDIYVLHEGTDKRQILNHEKSMDLTEKNVELASISAHYFTSAILDKSDVLPRFELHIPPQSPLAVGRLVHQPVNPTGEFSINYVGYAGPKDLQLLQSIDDRMSGIIDYGMFAVIAKPLLWIMKFFYSIFHNYGVAIIALTLLVRILVLPFNVYSYKSMKIMQVLQPKMQALREKHKDDPPTMNREVMALMKAHKANPLGGCLPMLLQLPVFFALYQVLGQSIELYRAPFALWINDLSVKDHFYVLPVLMGITMFIQQKITPTTMDPQQAKIMLFMPIIFSFLMLSLPSGLTLYIFVSTLFGIVQQYYFMRDKVPNSTTKEAKA